uniref:Uncharacterized protein n=1 Tax=Lepeophtheirus salmonis TaxID=72036 RepID=A0A0K2T1Z9_LEPSM
MSSIKRQINSPKAQVRNRKSSHCPSTALSLKF